jgi:hypothetical protein
MTSRMPRTIQYVARHCSQNPAKGICVQKRFYTVDARKAMEITK